MTKVLIIGHGLPQPKSTGAGVYMVQLLELLRQFGCRLHFCSSAEEAESGVLKEMDIPYSQIELNSDSFDSYIKELNPQIVVFDRFMTEEQYSWRVREQCPDAIRVLDTEDLHFLRAHRAARGSFMPPLELSDLAKRELAAIYRSDISLIISESEMLYLEQLYKVPSTALFHLPFLVKDLPEFENLLSYQDRADFCFVGTAKHKPNVDAIKTLHEIWPQLRLKIPGAKLHIYGSYFQEDILQLHKPDMGFMVEGFVDDLGSALGSHRLLLAPLNFGAGQKRKVFDAWLAGCPVITTLVGAEGISNVNEFAGLVAENDAHFINSAVELYTDAAKWKEAQLKAQGILQKFSWDHFALLFKAQMEDLVRDREFYLESNPVGQLLWHHSLQSSKYLSKWIQEKNKGK